MRVLAHVTIHKGPMYENDDYPIYLLKKYEPYAIKVDWDIHAIDLYKDQPEYEKLMSELKGKRLRVAKRFIATYTAEEYNSADYLILWSDFISFAGKPEWFYHKHCPNCNVYLEQHRDLFVKKSDLSKRLFLKVEGEYVVSPELKAIFEREGVTGANYRNVFYPTEHTSPVAYQLVVHNILDPMHESTNCQIKSCKGCSLKTIYIPPEEPIFYDISIKEKALDFNLSYELSGSGFYPRPNLIVSQKVRQIMLANKVKDIRFIPIQYAK